MQQPRRGTLLVAALVGLPLALVACGGASQPAAPAMLAYQGGVEAAAGQAGAQAKEIKVGDQAVRYDVAQTAQGVSQATVVALQGKYFIVIGFASTPGDLPTDDIVLTIAQKQIDKVKAAG